MAQSLTDIMSQIRGGYALNEAGKKIAELVKAVKETGKAGEISFTIKVAPDKTDDRVVTMKPSIKAKIPERGFSEGIFFLGPDGRLTKEDPAQLDMLEQRRADGVLTIAQQNQIQEDRLTQVGRGT